MFSGSKTSTKKSGRCMLISISSKTDSTYCTIMIHCASQFCKDLIRHIYISRMNKTISMFREQRFDSMLNFKWFTSLIQICSNRTFSSKRQQQQQRFFPFDTCSCSAPWQELPTFLCNQHGWNVTCSTRVAARCERSSTHCFYMVYNCWRPLWASTFLDIKFPAAMQQCFNRPARSCIFECLGHVGLCLYAKGQVQVLQAWQIWGTPFLHLIALQLALQKLWDDLAPCQCYSKRLSQTCIAVILVWCDKHVPGIRKISKTG